jgi:hypothetical protein
MRLTGKCKEAFEKWFLKGVHNVENYHRYVLTSFYSKSEAMQYGVYVDFFDSIGIDLDTFRGSILLKCFYAVVKDFSSQPFKTRPEARTAALEKANEIYNKKQKL